MDRKKTKTPDLSIIIPVFNDNSGLQRCLESITKQSVDPERIQVVVVDNGSSPRIEIREKFKFPLTLIYCATPGSYAARNAGVRASTAPALAFTDADCIAEPSWALTGITSLLKQNGDTVIGGEVRMLPPEKQTVVALYQTIVGFEQRENIEHRGFSVTANLFCTRSAFDEIGSFDERLLSGGDLEWCWRAKGKGFEVAYAPDAIVGTTPRYTLRGAIRQARRVAAGRMHLAGIEAVSVPSDGLKPHRSIFKSISWIMQHPDLSPSKRILVLAAASIIRTSVSFELARLRVGGLAERR